MPTAFTHAVVGAACAPATPHGVSPRRLAAVAALLAVAPDLDVAAFAVAIPYAHPLGHRGLWHAPLFAGLAALAATALAFRGLPRFGPAWWRVFALLWLAAASHGLLDAATDAGLGVAFLMPFDDVRLFLPWRPLETSPIGIGAFLSGPALRILAIEIVWVWLPALGIAAAIRAWRRRRAAVEVRAPW